VSEHRTGVEVHERLVDAMQTPITQQVVERDVRMEEVGCQRREGVHTFFIGPDIGFFSARRQGLGSSSVVGMGA
jgi:hypothetical protein